MAAGALSLGRHLLPTGTGVYARYGPGVTIVGSELGSPGAQAGIERRGRELDYGIRQRRRVAAAAPIEPAEGDQLGDPLRIDR
jgi:hypothetical protein